VAHMLLNEAFVSKRSEDKPPDAAIGGNSELETAIMPKTDYTNVKTEIISKIGCVDDGGRSPALPENIHAELEEARFISSFMAAVYASLELEDICSIAARALYEHVPYYRIVFAFSDDLEGRTITFSPMLKKGNFAASPKNALGSSCSLSALPRTLMASAHLTLLDNMGTITIDYKAGQARSLSDSLIMSVEVYFSQAIRNALEHSKVKDLAMRDGLTKLFNRRVFDETLAQKVNCQDTCPVSLLLIDLDNFKKVNDNFGHQAGDQVLKTVARNLKECCRGQDLVTRFGGEEFAIILSQTQATVAHVIAQRIRSRLAGDVYTFDGTQIRMTASIGLATCQEGSSIFTSNLVKQADRALYQAKRTGKNKVCVYPAGLLSGAELPVGTDDFGSLVPACC
jgi:two-component system cell cycle response regulator